MLTLLTRPPYFFSKTSLKDLSAKLSGKHRGPQAVLHSLERGLRELHVPFQVNPPRGKESDTVHVVSGVESLAYAIDLKRGGKVKYLIAGPNIVINPKDNNAILLDPAIDAILLPSEWTKKMYADITPQIADKIRLWPSGVHIPEVPQQKRLGVIVYKKNIDEGVYQEIIQALKKKNIVFKVFIYGKFKRDEYYEALSNSEAMIYLQNVESQGIALQEAWARNVPTLAFYSGSFTYPDGYIVEGNVSAPYLTKECGFFFRKEDNIDSTIDNFMKHLPQFSAREYCIRELSDKASAEKYVSIINEITKSNL